MSDAYDVIAYAGRELPAEYFNMVASRWMRSLRYGNDYFRLMVPETFYKSYYRFIVCIIEKTHTVVRLAVLADDHDVVLGFSVVRGGPEGPGRVLEYIHVHKDQRRQGIAARLVPASIDTITHLTRTGLSIWGSKHPEWKFDPFA